MSNDDENGAAIRLAMHPPRGPLIDLSKPTLGRDTQDQIGRDLRLMYAGLLREPLPDRLLDLIARLGLTTRRTLQ
jgi:Anti-sigma factor NepR